MIQVPSNSNIALLIHMIERSGEPEAIEMWIISALIEYAEACLAIDVNKLSSKSEKNMAANMQKIAFDFIKTIEMKHPKDKNLH